MKTFGKEQTKYTYCARNKKEEMDQTHKSLLKDRTIINC